MNSIDSTANDTAAEAAFPYDGPAEWRSPITRALQRVMDPEVAMTIVDVGLVYGILFEPGRLHAQVTMTSAACPVTDLILEEVEAELERVVPAGTEIDVELVWDPAWTTERMSPRAKAFMGW
jgi:metal-sulfur cluster biosynthetic enzyme